MNCRLTHISAATVLLEVGPIRFTSNAKDAVRIVHALNPGRVIPIHYEGRAHFREPKGIAAQYFTQAGLADRIQWLPLGKPVELAV